MPHVLPTLAPNQDDHWTQMNTITTELRVNGFACCHCLVMRSAVVDLAEVHVTLKPKIHAGLTD